jgi:hypothetical protein
MMRELPSTQEQVMRRGLASNDTVERQAGALPQIEAALSESSTASLA